MASQKLGLPQSDLENLPRAFTTSSQVTEQFDGAKARLMDIIAMKDKTPIAISPSTESRARFLLHQWEDILPTANPVFAARWAQEIDKRLVEMNQRLTEDAKYVFALARLEDLNIMVFQLRYTDYMASYKNDPYIPQKRSPVRIIPTHALSLGTHQTEEEALALFENGEWSAIHHRLITENGPVNTSEFPTNPWVTKAPMIRLIQKLATLTETKALNIYHLIRTCSQGRHSYVGYNHFFPFEINTQLISMHLRIQKHLSGLSSAPYICRPDIQAIRDTILQVADKYFEIFIWSEQLRTWTRCKWQSVPL
ncbi:hypothetical protein TrVFT333_001116 [Trichoderma virens FT-333]|nr:hypothetical protein TrVFT333_001116 [Trichoderma virens FT-333]